MSPMRILLAEDRLASQKPSVSELENWGHTVETARDGHEAVAKLNDAEFDLVLMDVHLPEMAGLEATRLIRERELATGRHVTILAITADSCAGERERCIEAGMDGHVSKPIRRTEFNEAVAALSAPVACAEADSRDAAAGDMDTSIAIDWPAAIEAAGGDAEVLRLVVRAFLGEAQELIDRLVAAVASENHEQVALAAHTIRGSMRLYEIPAVSGLASQLEGMGRSRSLDGADALALQLKDRLELVYPHLERFVDVC